MIKGKEEECGEIEEEQVREEAENAVGSERGGV
jgi:hypothetical protein